MRTGGRRGVPNVLPQKTLKNLVPKMQYNTKKMTPPPLDFLATPSTPSKEFENDCASMPKFLGAHMLFGQTLRGSHYFVFYCIFMKPWGSYVLLPYSLPPPVPPCASTVQMLMTTTTTTTKMWAENKSFVKGVWS